MRRHRQTARAARRATAIGAATLIAAIAAGNVGASGEDEPIKIGVLVTSEGPFANNAATAQAGAEYAADVLNEAGGINGRTVELIVADSHGQPDQLATIMPRLAEDGVVAIVGPVESSSCDVACPLAKQLELPLVSPGAARPGVLEPGRPYSFSLGQPDAANSTPALESMISDRGIESAAIIYDEANATTAAQADLFRAVFESNGVEIVDEVTFATGDSSFAAQVTRIADSAPDAVALAAGPADAGRIAVEVEAQGLDTQLLGTGALMSDIEGYIEAAGSAADGTLSAAQYNPNDPDPTVAELQAAGREHLGVDEVPLNFAYAYDAMNILATIMTDGGLAGSGDSLEADRVAIQEALNGIDGFVGMAGRTTFGDDGFSVRPVIVAEVVDGAVVMTEVGGDDEAPATSDAAGSTDETVAATATTDA